jgi:hypothetical protein
MSLIKIDSPLRSSLLKKLKRVLLVMTELGGILSKATSLRIFLFFISLMEGFISEEETLCQSDSF